MAIGFGAAVVLSLVLLAGILIGARSGSSANSVQDQSAGGRSTLVPNSGTMSHAIVAETATAIGGASTNDSPTAAAGAIGAAGPLTGARPQSSSPPAEPKSTPTAPAKPAPTPTTTPPTTPPTAPAPTPPTVPSPEIKITISASRHAVCHNLLDEDWIPITWSISGAASAVITTAEGYDHKLETTTGVQTFRVKCDAGPIVAIMLTAKNPGHISSDSVLVTIDRVAK